ncbi:MAG: hypothetical protein WA306_09330 [Candidatus Acidiferrales bacterium]
MSRKTATIRRWYGTYGIAHAFVSPTTPPNKYFVHNNNRKDPSAVLAISIQISFVEGPSRNQGELPQALEIDVVSVPTRSAEGVHS